MTKKVRLVHPFIYLGVPYMEDAVVEIQDNEGAFLINSGGAVYVADDTPVTPPPDPGAFSAATEAVKKAEEERLKAMLPSERHKLEEAKKKADEDKKWKEEDDKAKAEAAKKLEAARKAEEDKIKIGQDKEAAHHASKK